MEKLTFNPWTHIARRNRQLTFPGETVNQVEKCRKQSKNVLKTKQYIIWMLKVTMVAGFSLNYW